MAIANTSVRESQEDQEAAYPPCTLIVELRTVAQYLRSSGNSEVESQLRPFDRRLGPHELFKDSSRQE